MSDCPRHPRAPGRACTCGEGDRIAALHQRAERAEAEVAMLRETVLTMTHEWQQAIVAMMGGPVHPSTTSAMVVQAATELRAELLSAREALRACVAEFERIGLPAFLPAEKLARAALAPEEKGDPRDPGAPPVTVLVERLERLAGALVESADAGPETVLARGVATQILCIVNGSWDGPTNAPIRCTRDRMEAYRAPASSKGGGR